MLLLPLPSPRGLTTTTITAVAACCRYNCHFITTASSTTTAATNTTATATTNKPVSDWLKNVTAGYYCTEYVRVFPIGHNWNGKKLSVVECEKQL